MFDKTVSLEEMNAIFFFPGTLSVPVISISNALNHHFLYGEAWCQKIEKG